MKTKRISREKARAILYDREDGWEVIEMRLFPTTEQRKRIRLSKHDKHGPSYYTVVRDYRNDEYWRIFHHGYLEPYLGDKKYIILEEAEIQTIQVYR